MIYLDNSATTKPCAAAVEAMTGALTENWGNPSALYSFGIDTGRQLRAARQQVAAAMGAEPDRVFFTSGGTEADNWAIYGTAKRSGDVGYDNIGFTQHPFIAVVDSEAAGNGFYSFGEN